MFKYSSILNLAIVNYRDTVSMYAHFWTDKSKLSISFRFHMQKKGFSLFLLWIVYFSSFVCPGKLFRNCLTLRFSGQLLKLLIIYKNNGVFLWSQARRENSHLWKSKFTELTLNFSLDLNKYICIMLMAKQWSLSRETGNTCKLTILF